MSEPAEPLLVTEGLCKSYRGRAVVQDVSLRIAPGEFVGLLGPNGAGKTTAMRCITGALTPDRGTVRTLGLDPATHGEHIRQQCGVVSAKPALYDRLSGRDNLRYAAALYGV
ncbi:MAG: ATP-binding cassette domain-containing protein, partial [Planctomycetota bacterium]|nr:ATP-binding cassette domain-containing protein [Planctomycetota bacterium]